MDNQQQNFNKEIIQDYINGISANKLSKKYNKNISSIMYLLNKNNVPTRNIKEAVFNSLKQKGVIFTEDFHHILFGLLMGDGSLRLPKKGINPYYTHTDKNLEAINHFKKLFEERNIIVSKTWMNRKSNCYSFQTETLKEFIGYYQIFYPNGSKKILPDVVLQSLSLKYWFIGDGSIKKQNESINNAAQISNKWGNEFILRQMKTLFHINCNYYKDKKRNCGNFYIPHEGFIKFLEFIGNCPIKCYDYKWFIKRCSTTIMEKS